MYLKKLKLQNFRKFSTDNNVIEFISSKIVQPISDENGEEEKEIDVASDTTLIIGKNNAGKTTIITALDNLINNENLWSVHDFNYRYLQKYLQDYDTKDFSADAPYIEFLITVALEENSQDRISNLIPFMLVEDINDSELDIGIRYEVSDLMFFHTKMFELYQENIDEKELFSKFLKLLGEMKYTLKYYDKNWNPVNEKFKLANLMDIKCIKANHIKSEYCLTESFNKIVNYRYNYLFHNEKEKITNDLEDINKQLTENISRNHTDIMKDVLAELVSTDRMGIDLSADITFDKLMKDLIRYEYIEDGVNIPESQFGLGYTNLIMIIASIMDYMEKYPDAFNTKINLVSIEEPETFMHPQMQELFIRNINQAIKLLFESKEKDINSQIIITTHSSHILNSKIQSDNTFNNICYLNEKKHCAKIINLCNDKVMPSIDKTKERCTEELREKNLKFLKKHIKFKASELFFSDAVIFVEGFTEETLLPFFIEQNEKLSKYYISVFNINGAHGFIYENLIKTLGIPTLLITDLDIKRDNKEEKENKEDIAEKKKNIVQISCLDGLETTNETIKKIYGKSKLDKLPSKIEVNNLYLAYQGKINQYYATSFEEAFILTNYNNIIVNETLSEVKPNIYKRIVGGKDSNYENNLLHSYEWQVKLEKNKGEFASKLFFKLINSNESDLPKLPEYILKGFSWLEKRIGENNGII